MKLWSKRFEPRKARIELIPMIDTMVFLLVFFMIASLAMAKQKGMPVSLPGAKSAPKATWADRAVVITESAQGVLYIDKKQIKRDALEASLAEILKAKKDSVVVVNADGSLRHREIVWLMDQARQAGAVHMAIATDGQHSEGELQTAKSN
jgi:biopolymer transport protein ExbD